jgi:glutathione synthase/RimK-type ligase-like ATP-grasp enzyme
MKHVFFITSLLMLESGFDKESTILRQSMEKHGIKSKLVAWNDPDVDWSEADLSIIRTPHDYFLDVPSFLEWTKQVEKHTTLWNSSNVIEWNSHKKYLVELQDVDVPVPPTLIVEHKSKVNLDELLEDTDWEEIIIKPAVSIGAWGAKWYERGSPEAQKHLEDILIHGYEHVHARTGKLWNLEPGDAIIQKFIPEIMTQGEASLIYFGGKYSHAVKKMPQEGEFRVHDVYGGQVLDYNASDVERRVAEMGLKSLGMETQYARIDTILSKKGPVIIEMELIEPRLFFEYHPQTAESYADHIENYLNR